MSSSTIDVHGTTVDPGHPSPRNLRATGAGHGSRSRSSRRYGRFRHRAGARAARSAPIPRGQGRGGRRNRLRRPADEPRAWPAPDSASSASTSASVASTAIRAGAADMLPRDGERLDRVIDSPRLRLTSDAAALAVADTIFICVPTPVDERFAPRSAPTTRRVRDCRRARAHRGQLIVLTSTTYVGTTTDLLIEPLRRSRDGRRRAGLVAFSPERIDPGNSTNRQEDGAAGARGRTEGLRATVRPSSGTDRRARPPCLLAGGGRAVAKLYENSFRAVNIGFANEMAESSRRLGIDPVEVLDAAATKPYGFMAFYPGRALAGTASRATRTTCAGTARRECRRANAGACDEAIADGHSEVVERAVQLLTGREHRCACPRVLVVGVTVQAGCDRDTRESPALEIIHELRATDAEVALPRPASALARVAADVPLLSVAVPTPTITTSSSSSPSTRPRLRAGCGTAGTCSTARTGRLAATRSVIYGDLRVRHSPPSPRAAHSRLLQPRTAGRSASSTS